MVDEVLTKYGKMIVAQLQSDIRNKPLPRRKGQSYVANASGKLANSVNFKVENGVLRIYADSYIYFLAYGRKPTTGGSKPGKLKDIIREWIDAKGIEPYGNISKDSLAFLITRSIHKNGTSLYPQGSTLLSDIVNETLINGIKNDLFTSFSDGVLESFRTLKQAA
jgi:hypothetical protein